MIECMDALARVSDWVLPGLKEGRVLPGCQTPEHIASHYLDRGARYVAVKLGAEGSYWADRHGGGTVPGEPVRHVVDTVGAGDGFAVGVVSALLEGRSLEQAACRGNAIGARVVQFPDDSDGLPTRAQLDEAV